MPPEARDLDDNDDNAKDTRHESSAQRLLLGAVGIYLAYLTYGHVQEDVYQVQADGSRFTFVWFLHFWEALANIAVGFVARTCLGQGTPGLPIRPFASAGTCQMLAKALTSRSLAAGLSFPVCQLAKSGKIVPVMLGQWVMGKSKYRLEDWCECS